MTFNHLTGITISALLHAGLVGLAMTISNKPIKKPVPLDNVFLTVSMFQNEVIPPPKPAPVVTNVAKPIAVKPKINSNIKPPPTIKVTPVVAVAAKIKPKPIATKAVTKIATKKAPHKVKPSKVKVVKKKVYKKPAKKLVRKKSLNPIRKVVKKTAPRKTVKRKPERSSPNFSRLCKRKKEVAGGKWN